MKRWAVVFAAALSFIGCSREKGTIVAEVDEVRITSDQFQKRYEQYLAQGGKRDNIKLRLEVLNNMINEELMYKDLARRGMDRDSVYRRRMDEALAQALLDGYARRISFDTITITDREVQDEFRFYNTKASARYLYAKTEKGAWELKRRLERGETFESLARQVFEDPGLATNGGYLGVFGWGEMETALEQAAFTLPLGTVSDPIKLRIGYAIVKPESRMVQPLASESDYFNVLQKLADRVQEKKIDRLVRRAADEIVKGLAPSFNEQAVNEVFKHWGILVRNETPEREQHALAQNISTMRFMQTTRGTWSVGEFIARVEWTTEKQRRRVRSTDDVKDVAIGLAAREVMLERARAMGLENDSTVRGQVANVRQRFLLRRWADTVEDTVGNSGWDARLLDSVYQANKQYYAYPPEVNVAEILVRTEEEAKALRRKLDRGADFATLARTHSIRLWAAKRGGELGFGTQATFGPMGEKFFKASIGELLGPEWVDPYWAIFKILEKKPGRPKSYAEAREDVIAGLLPQRKIEAVRSALSKLRSRSSITINTAVLETITITTDHQAKR